MKINKVRQLKKLLFVLLFINLLNISLKPVYAEGFNRVKRQKFKLSVLSGLSFNTYRFSTGQYYYFTPYIYLITEPYKDFEINLYLPFELNFEKYYRTEQYYNENMQLQTKEITVLNLYLCMERGKNFITGLA